MHLLTLMHEWLAVTGQPSLLPHLWFTDSCPQVLLLAAIVLLLVGVEARKKPGQAKARARKARVRMRAESLVIPEFQTERSWHVAGPEGEESCGNYTDLLTTETPSSQCSEVSRGTTSVMTRLRSAPRSASAPPGTVWRRMEPR